MVGSRQEWFGKALIAQLPALRRYARALTGNTALADDLVQDCIERALRQWEGLRDLQRLASWLRSILHNLYIDELRRSRSRGHEEEVTEMADDLALSTPAQDGTTAIDFVRAMGRLSVEHRQVLLLVGLENKNYRDVADELGIPIGTVMSRLARGRERLRNALEGERPAQVRPIEIREMRQ
ncbi:MAG TPA: sigma-70 family RNA polymerase sigma factor [Rhizomicrobium sp.]|nr:sigma-70 family RNA polymerase sigma factor [Rhizomicrobium sp.]